MLPTADAGKGFDVTVVRAEPGFSLAWMPACVCRRVTIALTYSLNGTIPMRASNVTPESRQSHGPRCAAIRGDIVWRPGRIA